MVRSAFWIGLTALLLAGCAANVTDPTVADHSIRMRNNFIESINDVKIGAVEFGTVSSGALTSYKALAEGSHAMSGTTPGGAKLTGTVSVSGTGVHKWTVTIANTGEASMAQD